MPIKGIRDYTIKCTGDVAQGDEILFTEMVWGGSHRRPEALGERRIAALVVKDSYGAGKQQHTFTLLVRGSDGLDRIRRGTTIRRKGRNVYRHGTLRKERDRQERQDALDEKHQRGATARIAREERRAFEMEI